MLIKLNVETKARQEIQEITALVRQTLAEHPIPEGVCLLFTPHTTAGLTINSYRDPSTWLDLKDEMDRLVPTRIDFHHIFDTPSDASGHIKSSLVGVELSVIVEQGQLLLGDSQGIFFWEFDGPRSRSVYVKLLQG